MTACDDRDRSLPSGQTWSFLTQRLRLSPREAQILDELLNDKSEARIAREIGISSHTVHSHIRRMYRKLQVTSRSAAIARVFLEHLAVVRSLHPDYGRSSRTNPLDTAD